MLLKLKNFQYQDFFQPEGLARLDAAFLNVLEAENKDLYQALLGYRNQASTLSPKIISQIIIDAAPILESFISELFDIEETVSNKRLIGNLDDPIFLFKSEFVLKRVKRKLKHVEDLDLNFESLNTWLKNQIEKHNLSELKDRELAVAKLATHYFQRADQHETEIEQIIDWCASALMDQKGKAFIEDWASFRLPEKLDYQNLVPTQKTADSELLQSNTQTFRQRDGFQLTDPGMSEREVRSEANYCIYCHTNEGDFCSSGFPVKKSEPEKGLKTNPLGEIMTGCPLDEKVSEMNLLKKEGYTIASLAVLMIDNPLCPATGHRICNDCMKACIYQKQTPVDIPQIETGTLVDVLNLPWGVEIYDLLTRWNPLRNEQVMMKPFNGYKVMTIGMGPAGFSLAHYLTMEGCAVVGLDGLKIESLGLDDLQKPIYSWEHLKESLDDRVVAGFGGVSEYGITSRWDKNFLKLIYLTLMRRQPYFKVFGDVRFGGTVNVEDAFDLGFDHLSLAVGAGLPQAISVPDSLAPGMRQATDFLMALQLTGAAKKESLASLQIRLPAIVIGGGLTAVDSATEAQAYYIRQVEKMLFFYEVILEKLGKEVLDKTFNALEKGQLETFLEHGKCVREERQKALKESRDPDFLQLIRKWGGVTIVYRRSIQESPAYRFNHEELKKALEEGVYYLESLSPKSVTLDSDDQTQALVCLDENQKEHTLPAHSIFVATGSKPNVAYEFEHRGTFRRSGKYYDTFENNEQGELQEVEIAQHVKSPNPGLFTSYQKDKNYVSFLGDMHPVFQGSVVKAMASAKRAYPEIMSVLKEKEAKINDFHAFASKIDQSFAAKVVGVRDLYPKVFEIKISAPILCKNFRPGQFYRLQTYERFSKNIQHRQIEGVAAIAISAEAETGILTFILWKKGISARWLSYLKPENPISIMGPTGVRMKIPKDQETVLIMGESLSIPVVLALGSAMKAAGNRVICMGCFETAEEMYFLPQIMEATDQIIWMLKKAEPVKMQRPQDVCLKGDFLSGLLEYHEIQKDPQISLNIIDRVIVNGSPEFLSLFRSENKKSLKGVWSENVNFICSVYGMMQCMLKGICAQCLQWQINPETGERTKAVFACSWQDQPMELVDFEHLSQRLQQNHVQEKLYGLWDEVS